MSEKEHWTSYSALDQHRTCPQSYMYDRIRRLESVTPEAVKVELEFGNWWHALRAADSVQRGRVLGTLRSEPAYLDPVREDESYNIAIDVTERPVADVLASMDRWWRSLSSDVHEIWQERLGAPLPDRLRYADERWRETWKDELEYEQPVGVEMKWTRRLPALPSGVDANTMMIGYIDEVYFDDRRKLLVARDHKAHRDITRQSVVDDMMDSQLQVYAWGAAQEVSEWGFGPIKAVAYDRMRMVAPSPPQLTQSGRLAQRGGQPSIGQCDLHTYLEWSYGVTGEGVPYPGLKKDGSGAGFYTAEESVISLLSSEQSRATWFQRTLTPLNRNIIQTHLRAAVDSALDVIKTKERVAESGMAGRNLTRSCTWCDFVKLCRAEMVGGPDADYDLSEYGLRQKN